jgi:hypothetical protein
VAVESKTQNLHSEENAESITVHPTILPTTSPTGKTGETAMGDRMVDAPPATPPAGGTVGVSDAEYEAARERDLTRRTKLSESYNEYDAAMKEELERVKKEEEEKKKKNPCSQFAGLFTKRYVANRVKCPRYEEASQALKTPESKSDRETIAKYRIAAKRVKVGALETKVKTLQDQGASNEQISACQNKLELERTRLEIMTTVLPLFTKGEVHFLSDEDTVPTREGPGKYVD